MDVVISLIIGLVIGGACGMLVFAILNNEE